MSNFLFCSHGKTPEVQLKQARKLRKKVRDFRPNKDNKLVKKLASWIVPGRLKKSFGVVDVIPVNIDRIEQLRGQRMLLCPNHPNSCDPEVMFSLAVKLALSFNFGAAREAFDYLNGLNGWLMQLVGCFSIVRGTVDREAFKKIVELLAANARPLVLFPEGEIGHQNDELMPIEPGPVQLSFMALEEMAKDKTKKLEPIYLVPIGIKYRYIENVMPRFDRALIALEKKLNVPAEGSIYERLRRVSEKFMRVLQKYYKCKPADGQTIDEQIIALRDHILERVAAVLNVTIPDTVKTTLDALRFDRNSLDALVYPEAKPECEYEEDLTDDHAADLLCLYRDLRRVQVFIAIRDNYVADKMTQERMSELIDKLEFEFFGEPTVKGPRVAVLYIGNPINLLNYFEEYKLGKKQTLKKLSKLLEGEISTSIELGSAIKLEKK